MRNDDTAGGTVHQPMTHKESNLTSRNRGFPRSKFCWNPGPSPLKMMVSKFGISFFRGGYVSFREGTLPQTKMDNYHITKPTFIICIPSPITYPSSSTHRVPPQKKSWQARSLVWLPNCVECRSGQGQCLGPRFHCDHWMISIHTVDGRNPAPPGWGFYTSRWCRISEPSTVSIWPFKLISTIHTLPLSRAILKSATWVHLTRGINADREGCEVVKITWFSPCKKLFGCLIVLQNHRRSFLKSILPAKLFRKDNFPKQELPYKTIRKLARWISHLCWASLGPLLLLGALGPQPTFHLLNGETVK